MDEIGLGWRWPVFSTASLWAAGLALLGAGWGLAGVGRWTAQRERRAAGALAAVMAATTLRRSRPEALSVALERAAEALAAASGSLHLIEAGRLRLINAVRVEGLGLLSDLPLDDPFLAALLASDDGVLVEAVDWAGPWRALLAGAPRTVVAVRIGGRAQPAGVVALTWPGRWQAEGCLQAVTAVAGYAQQMLAEFDDLERRARDVQALTAALQRQESLARTAAHDLANKLTTAYGLVSLLAEAPAAAEGGPALAEALRQLALMDTMLADLSDPERAITPERVPVEAVVELAAAMMRRPQAEGRVLFAVQAAPALPAVWGERLAILRVLDNLLMNALRHNAEAEALEVWLTVAQLSEARQVLFEVGDNGQGIAPEALATLFEFGVRADSTGRVHGHGIGLWSCRRLVDAHGGRLWVESAPGQGARFCFTLPAAAEEAV